MKRWLVYSIFISLYIAVTFFGLGPVFIADGGTQERMVVLMTVIVLYMFLTYIFLWWIKKNGIKNAVKYTITIILYIVVTYVGLGTIFVSERPSNEKMLTLGIAICLFVMLTGITLKWIKNRRRIK
jgi:hypothetical protein